MNFMDDSEWRRRRFAPLVLPVFSFAAFMGCGLFAAGILYILIIPAYYLRGRFTI